MDIHELKQRLQSHFTDGLVTIIGSGLSCAEGLPGMRELTAFLKTEIPQRVNGTDQQNWEEILNLLDEGLNIEEAMLRKPPTQSLEAHIVDITAKFLIEREATVVSEVITGQKTLRFTRLLAHMLKPEAGIPVITTNYDRLIEIATERALLGVDTMFVGHHLGVLNERESRMSFCRAARLKARRHVRLEYAERVLLLKPHGSLDWFLLNDDPVRCPLSLSESRLIITPGLNKFRTGYDRPFDAHREKANECIDRATRFLIVGYGFNDDHLQTHLAPKLREGAPALVLVKRLSENARGLIGECDGMFALTERDDTGLQGTRYVDRHSEEHFAGPALWDLGVFVREVFEA